jgi:hypothetical protein
MLKKPATKYSDPAKYETYDEQIKALEAHYDRARVFYRQELVPITPDEDKIASFLSNVSQDIKEFYRKPHENIAAYRKPAPDRYPCTMCDYVGICQRGESIEENSFTFKKHIKIGDH